MERSTPKRRTPAPVAKKSGPPADIDAYLARVPEPARSTLERLRKTIKAAAPGATEGISYQLPTFRLLGNLVAFGASAKHCALYVMSGTVLGLFADDLSDYDTSKGTIRFPAGEPLPPALVKKLVKARIAENQAKATPKKAGGAKPDGSRARTPARAKRARTVRP